MATRGFSGRGRNKEQRERLPPGQSLVSGFPVLSAGPTPVVDLNHWKLELKHGPRLLASWDWQQFNALPQTRQTVDIHCVTTWSKFDTVWQGVLIEDLLSAAGIEAPSKHLLAHCFDDYSTNVRLADLQTGKAMVATHYDDQPLTAEHGGPARLLVPHLYFWKSAKWLNKLQFVQIETAGFWELRGYHLRGDPFEEQRYGGP
ncbi:sulfite oxidase-like oxidoreductase [Pseudoxanthomonas dokdonensis]|uniref:Molybdopterin-binding protein n=1 Tax=Pseudoxanthomonas dokdonensis TaxID=344882 RepID=A0A0R0CSZ6_9GAMM|nr:sulfite oxidase-like oxidoreductase [Pseudoxanthomonas dokdonensis]KRG69022.1 molybdopterin-binding protein [Pseudoxanthomonas dokdonensis]